MGFYGLWYWKQAEKKHIHIVNWSNQKQALVLGSGVMLSAISYFIVIKNQSNLSVMDITLTIFSFIATFKETRKVLSGWLYWVILNLLSAYLFFNNGLLGYFILSLVYSVLSVYGYMAWRKIYLNTKDENK
jgi:nicotinamide mononucleotide transporter